MQENYEVFGDQPQPRFGHTVTQISRNKVVLFGGAYGDAGKFTISGETYTFEIYSRRWSKLDPIGQLPTPRAAHAASSVETMQMIIYGGASGGGTFGL